MSVIDEVKQRTDIVEVVGQYVRLTKSGRTLRGYARSIVKSILPSLSILSSRAGIALVPVEPVVIFILSL